ncbi:HAD family acid phosphatase [Streptacidiphilus carbonis]|uniref:HAD family acid phosphatase n=1 Tax=Streptacidiphilus carbonis TaxID=105422 RepID=UPI000A0691AD|nr:HAD family acid phosphatase [Streptacidiphilus carbonis]
MATNAARRPIAAVATAAACAAALSLGLAGQAAASAPVRSAAVASASAGAATSAGTVSYATWLADVSTATAPAQAYLQQRVAAASFSGKPAIVLDIDNTSLASYFNPSSYPVPATPPVLALAQYATAHGVKVFFVTGRPDLIDLVSKYNLTSVGYTVDGLYSRNPLQLLESLQSFKTAARKQIEADGYDVVANVGNSASDLAGGYADATFKLPDYDGLLD